MAVKVLGTVTESKKRSTLRTTLTEGFNPRELLKYGFERIPSEDFSDDGSKFKMYTYKGRIPTSYLKSNGRVYISPRLDRIEPRMNYDEYSKLPSYPDVDDYNGVPEDEVDIATLSKTLDSILDEFDSTAFDDVSDDDINKEIEKYAKGMLVLYKKAKRQILDKFDDMADYAYTNMYSNKYSGERLKKIFYDFAMLKNSAKSQERYLRAGQTDRRYFMSDKAKNERKKNMTEENFYYKDLMEHLSNI